MATYEVKLIGREEVAEATLAVYLEKPRGFQFRAGQFANVSLLQSLGANGNGNSRSLSIASAPAEPDLIFAMRMRDSAFKWVLKGLPLGAALKIHGPLGNLTLHEDAARPAAILTGGIGITPFRSMILDAAHRRLPHRFYLFYSNRCPEDAAFLSELLQIADRLPTLRLFATMTRMQSSKARWDGPRGYLSLELLRQAVGDLSQPVWYLAGPQRMVAAMQDLLDHAGVPSDAIRAEEFSGY